MRAMPPRLAYAIIDLRRRHFASLRYFHYFRLFQPVYFRHYIFAEATLSFAISSLLPTLFSVFFTFSLSPFSITFLPGRHAALFDAIISRHAAPFSPCRHAAMLLLILRYAADAVFILRFDYCRRYDAILDFRHYFSPLFSP